MECIWQLRQQDMEWRRYREELQIIYGLQSAWNKVIDSDIWKF